MITEFLTLALVIAASVGLILLVLIHDKKSAGCGDAVTGYAAFIEKSKYLNILRLK
jgi:preprotein translocase subunit SecG